MAQLDYSTLEAAERSAAELDSRFRLETSPHHIDNVRQAIRALSIACQALYIVRKHQDCNDRESRACDVAVAISDATEQLRETLYAELEFPSDPPPWVGRSARVTVEPFNGTYVPACGASED